ncbi:MAG: enoyl-CoA hydratase/isomerase family protein [Dehalococcoidales bacterium]|nr:enoyl-CoA hydratase/isomerase family protein [Dehalococcoidales bacterium]
MNYTNIILKKEDRIATITLNRPDRLNAISGDMIEELMNAFDDVDKDAEVRVVVITGAGKGFCSGADVQKMTGGAEKDNISATGGAEQIRQMMLTSATRTISRLRAIQKPTIAMVNGVAVGAGFDLALACDMRIGSENARFMNAFVRVGLFPGWGGTWFYPRAMGVARGLEYLFTGDFIESKDAERFGVVNRIVPAADLEKDVMTLARKIANNAPIPIKLMKMQVYEGLGMDLETALKVAAAFETITLTSEDHKEGVAAFREKRPAVFKGK